MSNPPLPMRSRASQDLAGTLRVPGDKSISHRALMLAALARGTTTISGLLEGEDVLATAAAVAALGANVERQGDGRWQVRGTGNGAMLDPQGPLDLGNAGTGVRLLMGLVAGQGLTATFTGDASLSRRPMGRITDPLALMGALVAASADGVRLPLTLTGTAPAIAVDYTPPVASAQVKSAVLLAGLGARGTTVVREKVGTRDHTERMLRHFSVPCEVERDDKGGAVITLPGGADPVARDVAVPADPSSAAFALVAALICPGSRIVLEGVMTNPHRTGLFATLREMGADLALTNERQQGGEPVADIVAGFCELNGVEVPAARAASMIDEYPILAVAAACATGETRMRGLSELRVKESDRLAAMHAGLLANGVKARIEGDDLIVAGSARRPGGATVQTHLDHRIAMSFLVLGLACDKPVTVDDAAPIATSFPGFAGAMRGLGARIEEVVAQ